MTHELDDATRKAVVVNLTEIKEGRVPVLTGADLPQLSVMLQDMAAGVLDLMGRWDVYQQVAAVHAADHQLMHEDRQSLTRQVDQLWKDESEAISRMRGLDGALGDLLSDFNRTRDNLGAALARIVSLEAGLINGATWPDMPQACVWHTCDYFTHYLAYGMPELVHEGFHAAERQCEKVRKRYEEHVGTCHECRTHFGHCPIERKLGETCQTWEKRLRV